MGKDFIDKVHDIVINNITNENFGVVKLASLIGLSTSQTLKKVRAITGKSVNQYIRELRLTEAAHLIKETDLAIAEIAFKVGFGSQSYFNKSFRKYYGITPGNFKIQNKEVTEDKTEIVPIQKHSRFQKKILYSILIVVTVLIGYVIIDKLLVKKTNDQPPSIAILPFKNINLDKENEYLADGMWDELLNHLSSLKGLDVRSRQSLEVYRGSNKSIIKIGKELNAAYILESSIQKFENKLRIITQLIDAENDKHLWSHEYEYELKDVFKIQCEMAKLITQQLNVVLTDEEVNILEKYPTENMEAYQLFLKGRLKIESREREDLESGIKLFEQAIILDSNYAEAYAELAKSYFYLGRGPEIDGVNKAKEYIVKALNIDPNTARAFSVRGNISDFEHNWEKSKENYEMAIALNPNDAQIQNLYATYFSDKPIPDQKKRLNHMRIAYRIDPLDSDIAKNLILALIYNEKYEEAEENLNISDFLFSKGRKSMLEIKLEVSKNKDWTEEIRYWEREIEKDPNNAAYYKGLALAYDQILNDDINAIKYAKKAYELDSTGQSIASYHYEMLLEGKKFNEAKKLSRSENFRALTGEKQQLANLWSYYYAQENYKKAEEVLNDSLMRDHRFYYFYEMLNNAQLGDKMKVERVLYNFYSLTGHMNWVNEDMAIAYAILKENDSMYHYLEKLRPIDGFRYVNSLREFNPYRKEERYKTLLKKHYLPITHWN